MGKSFDFQKPERIETLKHRLYTRDRGEETLKRSSLTARSDAPPGGWRTADEREPNLRPRRSWLTVLLIFSIIFFLIAAGFAGYTLYRGGNIISPTNVELLLDGPKTIKAGETLNLQVLMVNKNTTPLRSVDLIVEFASGTRSPLDVTKELPRTRLSLGTIKPGASINQAMKAVVFGEKDAEQEIKVSVEYRIADSNAIFDKVSFFRYEISSAPVALNLTLPPEINYGQSIDIDLEVVTTSAAPQRASAGS